MQTALKFQTRISVVCTSILPCIYYGITFINIFVTVPLHGSTFVKGWVLVQVLLSGPSVQMSEGVRGKMRLQ